MVTVEPLIVATPAALDVYVNIPLELELGGFNWKEPEPNTLDATVNVPIVGAGLLMTRFAVIEPLTKLPLASCTAVMATVPEVTIETVFPAMVAIDIFPDVNENAPGELVDVGAVKLKSALPMVFVGIVNPEIVGVVRDTVNVVLVEALAKLAVDA